MSESQDSYRAMTDDELFALVREPSPGSDHERRNRALEELFGRYEARVFHQSRRLLGTEDAARDMTQQVFADLLTTPPNYDASQRFHAWLYVVVRNQCLNLLRRRKFETSGDEFDVVLDRLIRSSASAAAEDRELDLLLDETCREELSEMEQKVVHLRFRMQMRVKQIDELLGLENKSGARTFLTTAKRKLQRALKERAGATRVQDLLGEG